MNDQARRRAFLASAATLGGAALLIAAIGPARRPNPRERASVAHPAPVVADAPALSQASLPKRRGARPMHERGIAWARPQARRFLRAFLRYQARGADARVRALLDVSAGARVRRYLAGLPPRPLGRVKSPRVVSLQLYGPHRGKAKASALLDYGGERSLFEFLLQRSDREWRVSELYP